MLILIKKTKAEVFILISHKVDFGAKNITRGEERHFIAIKRLIHHEDITILNIYLPSSRASKYVKQKQ